METLINASNLIHLVFVFCVAILLATAVKASPVDVDEAEAEIVENNEVSAEQEPDAIIADNDEQFSENVVEPEEQVAVDEFIPKAVEEETIAEVIDGAGEEVAVPYQEDTADEEDDQDENKDDDDDEITAEQWERIAGLEIPLCAQHTDEQHPLLLR